MIAAESSYGHEQSNINCVDFKCKERSSPRGLIMVATMEALQRLYSQQAKHENQKKR